jgi:hypothetical protein
LDSAFIAFPNEGAHIILVKPDASKGNEYQEQGKGEYGNGQHLHSETAK